MCTFIVHIHYDYLPSIFGVTNRIYNVASHVFSPDKHLVVTTDKSDCYPEYESLHGIRIRRFEIPEVHQAIRRYLDLGPAVEKSVAELIQYVRHQEPTCIGLYYPHLLPSFVLRALPEMCVVLMPLYFARDDMDPLFRSRRFKVALFGDGCLNDFLRMGLAPNQIVIVEKPIDTDFFRPSDVAPHPFRLLYVGRIIPRKRLVEFIQATCSVFHDYVDLHLHIVGDQKSSPLAQGAEAEVERIKSTALQLGLGDRIVFRGRLHGQDLLREYSEAVIHILPTNAECRSTVTQEALAMGLHCVNANRQLFDWPEFRPDGERLIHYVDRLDDFDPVIRKLLESNTRPDHRDFIEKNWSWHR